MPISTVFNNNGSQAVKIPSQVRFPDHVKKVYLREHGQELIISAHSQTWDSFFLNGPCISDDFMNERADQLPIDREAF